MWHVQCRKQVQKAADAESSWCRKQKAVATTDDSLRAGFHLGLRGSAVQNAGIEASCQLEAFST